MLNKTSIFPNRNLIILIKKTQLRLKIFASAFLLTSVLFGIMYGIYRDRFYDLKRENEFFSLYGLSENMEIITHELSDLQNGGFTEEKIEKALKTVAIAENDIFMLRRSTNTETAEKITPVSDYINLVKSYVLSECSMMDTKSADTIFSEDQIDNLICCGERLNDYFMLALDYNDSGDNFFDMERIIESLEKNERLFLSDIVSEVMTYGLNADFYEQINSEIFEKEDFYILKNLNKISVSDAEKKAEDLLGEKSRYKLAEGESDVGIFSISPEIYRFYCENAFVDITVYGGYLIRMNSERGVSTENAYMSEKELLEVSRRFLSEQKPEGYETENFILAGYTVTDGRFNIEYVYMEPGKNEIMCKERRITIGVIMDSGKVYSYDAYDFLKNVRN